jgi:hypothetical protein
MAKSMVLRFGSQSQTVMSKDVEELRGRAIEKARSSNGSVTNSDREVIEGMIKSQCENEKDILKQLFQTYASKVKKGIEILIEVSDILKMIDNADLLVHFTEHEVDMLKEAIKKIEEIPPSWAYYGDLFRQLKEPEYKDIIDPNAKE